MNTTRVVFPEDFPHQELHNIVERLKETRALYQRRLELAEQLLAIHGNTQSAVARELGLTPQAVSAYITRTNRRRAVADG